MTNDPMTTGTVLPTNAADQAWKVLGLVTDWVKHAESKAAGTVAAAGIVGGVLYGLINSQHRMSGAVGVAALICGLFAAASVFLAGVSLLPRLRSGGQPTSVLYFTHIASEHGRAVGSSGYAAALRVLLSDQERLVTEIAAQIWANAHVARRKYRWTNLGILLILLALVALMITVLLILVQ